jgi:predicted nucleic acid-binding protein
MINFAVVNRLDLLKRSLGDRARATEAVVFEIGRSASMTPNLGSVDCRVWFGKPIEIKRAADIAAVNLIRTARFGGRQNEPLKHLGESQTIHVLTTFREYAGSAIITDDGDAYRYAKSKGLTAKCTVDLLREMVLMGDVTAEEAFELAGQMESHDRTIVNYPMSAQDFR